LTHEVRNEFFGERPAAVLQGADVRS